MNSKNYKWRQKIKRAVHVELAQKRDENARVTNFLALFGAYHAHVAEHYIHLEYAVIRVLSDTAQR